MHFNDLGVIFFRKKIFYQIKSKYWWLFNWKVPKIHRSAFSGTLGIGPLSLLGKESWVASQSTVQSTHSTEIKHKLYFTVSLTCKNGQLSIQRRDMYINISLSKLKFWIFSVYSVVFFFFPLITFTLKKFHSILFFSKNMCLNTYFEINIFTCGKKRN